MSKLTIENVLDASLGESSNQLNVSFKKTVLIRDYETEVIEASTNVVLDKELNGAERTFVTALLRVQLEYEAYCNLLMKGLVTQTAFNNRKADLEQELNLLKDKVETITGKSVEEFIKIKL